MSQIYNGSFILGDTSATTLSAGKGIKLDTSVPGTIGISNDESVLWSGSAFNPAAGESPMTASVTLNESISNFEQIRLEFSGGSVFTESIILANPKTGSNTTAWYNVKKEQSNNSIYIGTMYKFTDANTLSGICCYGNNTQVITSMTGGYFAYGGVCKVVGINRINGGN